jgi:hypothetical protein
MKRLREMLAGFVSLGLAFGVVACDVDEGPMERGGERIDEGVEKAGDKVEDATDPD